MPDIIINPVLKPCTGQLEITMNFNKLIEIIDSLTARIAVLESTAMKKR